MTQLGAIAIPLGDRACALDIGLRRTRSWSGHDQLHPRHVWDMRMFSLQVWRGTTVLPMAAATAGGRVTLWVVRHPPPTTPRTHPLPNLCKTNQNLPLCCFRTRVRFRPLLMDAEISDVFQTGRRPPIPARILHCLHVWGHADVFFANMAWYDRSA